MTTKLFITADQVKQTTSISGGTDNGLIQQKIYYAQITDMLRILGQPLYDKIYDDLVSETPLTGVYETIFNKYIIDMHVFFSAYYFTLFNDVKQSNIGNVTLAPSNGQRADNTIELSEQYKALGGSVELNFRNYMCNVSIPEWGGANPATEETNIIGFY